MGGSTLRRMTYQNTAWSSKPRCLAKTREVEGAWHVEGGHHRGGYTKGTYFGTAAKASAQSLMVRGVLRTK